MDKTRDRLRLTSEAVSFVMTDDREKDTGWSTGFLATKRVIHRKPFLHRLLRQPAEMRLSTFVQRLLQMRVASPTFCVASAREAGGLAPHAGRPPEILSHTVVFEPPRDSFGPL
ncbi:hypothetical protein ALCH109712_09750 [Alkalicoccus chagannorensis]